MQKLSFHNLEKSMYACVYIRRRVSVQQVYLKISTHMAPCVFSVVKQLKCMMMSLICRFCYNQLLTAAYSLLGIEEFLVV